MSVSIQADETIQPEIGIDDSFLGKNVSLDLEFKNEEGNPITLAEAGEGKPIILALVYYNCSSIC